MPAAPDHWRFALAALGEPDDSDAPNGRGTRLAGPEPSASPSAGPETLGVRFAGPETLGTQGPDPFYFYGLVPWRPRRRVKESRAFADWLHEAAPPEVFVALARAAADMPPDVPAAGVPVAGRGLAFGFLRGLLFHFLLDRAVHPWVYWRSGFKSGEGPDPAQSARHARFEAALASSGARDTTGSPGALGALAAPPPRDMFRAEAPWLRSADALFFAAFPERYAPGTYPEAFRDMVSVLSFLWDPGLLKRRFFDALGARDSLPRAMVQPVTVAERGTIDYANAARTEWRVPATGETRNDSVAELTRGALADAKRATELLGAIESKAIAPDDESFAKLLGRLNHEGCVPGERMRFSDSAYGA